MIIELLIVGFLGFALGSIVTENKQEKTIYIVEKDNSVIKIKTK